MKLFKAIRFLIAVIIIAAIIINIKPIMRYFYPLKYKDTIKYYSLKYNLDPFLVCAVIKTESNFNNNAVSSKDAIGLMQLKSSTADWIASQMKISNYDKSFLYKPEFNIRMGCWYINDLESEFNSNTDIVLAAYNGGRGNVKKWLNDRNSSNDGQSLKYIPFKETDKYVKKVNVNYNIYKFLYEDEF